jgi:NAD(P)-dependent dehydrogenase (short-subunit alcohol dehydrogenase family)
MMMKDFKGKVAVVTGAASGIGYGLAERCAKEGMKLVLADVEEGALTKAEQDIKGMGAEVIAVKTDVSKAGDVEALAKKTLDAYGAVHLLFNNAGVSGGVNIFATTLNDWAWTLGVNLWGVIYGVHYFLPVMLKQDTECYIVNTASVAGLLTSTDNLPYAVSKHAVVALSETAYRELERAKSKVGISVICPGIINTNILDHERNRPTGLKNPPNPAFDMNSPQAQQIRKEIKRVFANGMSPEKVADIVFSGIRENKFYILPDAERFMPSVKARMEDILQGNNPRSIPVNHS